MGVKPQTYIILLMPILRGEFYFYINLSIKKHIYPILKDVFKIISDFPVTCGLVISLLIHYSTTLWLFAVSIARCKTVISLPPTVTVSEFPFNVNCELSVIN